MIANVIADILHWGSIAFVAVMAFVMCLNAGKWDDVSEEYWKEYLDERE